MTTKDIGFVAVGLLLWVAAGYKLLRAGRSSIGARPTYALVGCLAALAAAVTLQVSALFQLLDRIVGGRQALLVAEILALSALLLYQIALVILNDPEPSGRRRVRYRLVVAAAAMILMTFFYLLSSSSTYPGKLPPNEDLPGAVHLVVFVAYIFIGAFDIFGQALRFTRLGADRNLLRLALYGICAHAIITLTYATTKLVFVVLREFFGTGVTSIEDAITGPVIMLSALLVVIATTLPSWGPWVGGDRLAAWFGRYMSYLTLYQLWQALAQPDTVLSPRSRWADRLWPTDIDFRLTRRVIEIRDGLLTVRPYRDETVTRMADTIARDRRIGGLELDATVEAATIAVALATAARQAGRDVAPADPLRLDEQAVTSSSSSVVLSMAEEVAWLARVSHAFGHSSVVRATRDRWERQPRRSPQSRLPHVAPELPA